MYQLVLIASFVGIALGTSPGLHGYAYGNGASLSSGSASAGAGGSGASIGIPVYGSILTPHGVNYGHHQVSRIDSYSPGYIGGASSSGSFNTNGQGGGFGDSGAHGVYNSYGGSGGRY
ncbi:hypothetical protein GWI33_000769 [Rhynchophorus ferrugineus]|uniref:Uncharacterized protein n=1 Tax=Rhynchophorus ferrugineus TaxID=354439 RepID=A0A834HLW5_RHYFE|nr:hypothetical protein GWI33_000769 [Rhynchophorus ferrugineus]